MAKIKIKKESLEGPKRIPPGIYTLRFDGFEPAWTKAKDSYNLNPVMKIINHPELNDRRVYDNLNSNAGWIMHDLCHCFGVPLAGTADDPELPGEFTPAGETDPTKWKYRGDLSGQTGQVEVAEATSNTGKTYINVKRYLCQIPGCTDRHSDNLIK